MLEDVIIIPNNMILGYDEERDKFFCQFLDNKDYINREAFSEFPNIYHQYKWFVLQALSLYNLEIAKTIGIKRLITGAEMIYNSLEKEMVFDTYDIVKDSLITAIRIMVEGKKEDVKKMKKLTKQFKKYAKVR